ncbi:hypothetical protein BDW02DRAFT_170662 [Decorospora gaudefroyi]|uniref:Uncharacterized protein n=1 Tax=Decorospora gaudefroyi TaxID=184978 RepID=A0A6A5JYB5_9PLEO|nr:hypothetical protein BDW02DRAFT_170662 [Decorospora gaudefroyi]
MHITNPLLLPLTLLLALPPTSTHAAPTAAASPKNIYLTSCTTYTLQSDQRTSAAILYTAAAGSSNPSALSTLAPTQWAGSTQRVQLSGSIFESRIEAGAEGLERSSIAGQARLGRERFVCFRDGGSVFRFGEGVVGEGVTVCTAEFWCGSLGS